MKLYTGIPENSSELVNAVVTIGTFDGVHAGHRAIFHRLTEEARRVKGIPVVVTFANHPRLVLNPGESLKVLSSRDEKVREISRVGVGSIILLNFTNEMSRMSAVEFLENFLIKKLDMQALVIGYDHAFGKNREGDQAFLRQALTRYGISLIEVPELLCGSFPCSSSRIRQHLDDGDVQGAAKLLGRPYGFEGYVVRGSGRGKALGFPTANISLRDPDKLIPGEGVYLFRVAIEDIVTRWGVGNIGTNPTFHGTDRRIEIHLPGFEGDLYGVDCTVQVITKLRDEVCFSSAEGLCVQIAKDIERAFLLAREFDHEIHT